jgi:hypothetical protein
MSLTSLHTSIENLACFTPPGLSESEKIAYKEGHKTAKDGAAELAASSVQQAKKEQPKLTKMSTLEWLFKAQKCGVEDVELAARRLIDYYQGV